MQKELIQVVESAENQVGHQVENLRTTSQTTSQTTLQFACFALGILYILSVCFQSGFAHAELVNVEQHRMITIKGSQIEKSLSKPFAELSLVAVKNNRIRPIPFQFDDINVEGRVYFENSKVGIDGQVDHLDANDELLFMLIDAGARRADQHFFDGEVSHEIKVTTLQGEERYVYLLEGSRLRSDHSYVRYSAELGRLESDHYTLTVNKKNALNWDEFIYYAFSGEQESPLDTMKLRFHAGVVTPLPKVTLNNKQFVAKLLAEKSGPIRATSDFKVVVRFLKLPVFKVKMQIHFMSSSLVYDAHVKIPRVRRKLVYNPSLSISLDGNQLDGSIIKVPLQPELKGISDGVLSSDELAMIENGLDIDNNWIWVTTHKNLDYFSYIEYTDEVKPNLGLFLEDDREKKDKPERFRGQQPNVGFLQKDFPHKGEVGLKVHLLFHTALSDYEPKVISQQAQMPANVEVVDL